MALYCSFLVSVSVTFHLLYVQIVLVLRAGFCLLDLNLNNLLVKRQNDNPSPSPGAETGEN